MRNRHYSMPSKASHSQTLSERERERERWITYTPEHPLHTSWPPYLPRQMSRCPLLSAPSWALISNLALRAVCCRLRWGIAMWSAFSSYHASVFFMPSLLRIYEIDCWGRLHNRGAGTLLCPHLAVQMYVSCSKFQRKDRSEVRSQFRFVHEQFKVSVFMWITMWGLQQEFIYSVVYIMDCLPPLYVEQKK